MTELHAIIRGRVQLVMFRDFTRRNARRLGIVGSVRNLQDGSTEVIAQGDKETLERLMGALRRGSLLSRVDSVQTEWQEPTQTFKEFSIIY